MAESLCQTEAMTLLTAGSVAGTEMQRAKLHLHRPAQCGCTNNNSNIKQIHILKTLNVKRKHHFINARVSFLREQVLTHVLTARAHIMKF